MTKEETRPEQRPKGRPSVEEGARIDRAILEAARKVLLQQGEAASLNAVAKEAGLSRKSVYARYASREELFVAAVRLTLQDAAPVQFAPADAFEDRLANYVMAALGIVFSSAAMTFQQVLSTNVHIVPDMRDEMRAAARKIFFDPLLDLLEKAGEKGEIAGDEPLLSAQIIFNSILAYMMTSSLDSAGRKPAEQANERYARGLARIISQGLIRR